MGKKFGRQAVQQVHGRNMGTSQTVKKTQGNVARAAAPARADAAALLTTKAIVKSADKNQNAMVKKASSDRKAAIKALAAISTPKSIV